MNEFSIIRPITIGDAQLTSSSVAEPAIGTDADPAEWNAATNYATDAQATRSSVHKVFQRLAPGGIDASTPESAPTKWVEVQSTNRWRMFDSVIESQTSAAEEIVLTIAPTSSADRLAIINADCTSVRVQAGSEYDQTKTLGTRVVDDWLEYFYEPFEVRRDVIFEGLPLGTGHTITVTISAPGGTARVGALVLGLSKELGGAQFGASAGIIDYSTKETNALGYTEVVERPFSKRMNVALIVAAGKVDSLQRILAQYRATPMVWVGAGNLYESLIVYGFYRSFEVVIAYPNHSICNLEIEGLT